MSTRPQELNKIIADLRQIIVGKVAMPTDQIEQITLFLFLKQLSKKHDELVRIGSKELIFTGDWERYHFDVLLRHSGEELVKECREAVESLYKNPHIDPTVRKVFERSYLKILEPKVLSSFLSYLNDKFSDGLDLGDFYESLLPILGTQNELGQFRTPRHIIDFIVRVVDPNIGEKIADPACGTAGFLVSAFNYLKEKYTDEKGRLKLNPEQIKQLYNEAIFGWDMEPLMVKFSLANLYLHGLKVPNVTENDTLLNENLWQHTFDIIVANPPFITPKGGARRHSRFAIKSNKTEVLFCEWIVNHLNFNGRMGIIVPEGIIFDRSRGHKDVRKLFIDNGLWCVVSLPSAVFQPYSGVKTSIVFLDKTVKPTNLLFAKITNHGFSLNTNPFPIDKNDIPQVLEFVGKYIKSIKTEGGADITNPNPSVFSLVPIEKILATDDITLLENRYKEIFNKHNSQWPLVEIEELCDLGRGRVISKKDIEKHKGQYPVFSSQTTDDGIFGYIDSYDFDGEYVTWTTDGANAGTVFYRKGKFNCTNVCGTLKAKTDKVLMKYLARVLNVITPHYVNYVGNPKLMNNIVAKIKIPLPSIEIQKKIIDEFDGYQKRIDEHNKEITILKQKMEDKIKSIWES